MVERYITIVVQWWMVERYSAMVVHGYSTTVVVLQCSTLTLLRYSTTVVEVLSVEMICLCGISSKKTTIYTLI